MLISSIILADLNVGLFIMQMLLFLTSVFLMLLVLVQRGKGGGLTGALGGSGGSSAFGAKAGDAFTKITIYVAVFWITLCILTIGCFNKPPNPQAPNPDEASISATDDGEAGASSSGDEDTTTGAEDDDAAATGDSEADDADDGGESGDGEASQDGEGSESN